MCPLLRQIDESLRGHTASCRICCLDAERVRFTGCGPTAGPGASFEGMATTASKILANAEQTLMMARFGLRVYIEQPENRLAGAVHAAALKHTAWVSYRRVSTKSDTSCATFEIGSLVDFTVSPSLTKP